MARFSATHRSNQVESIGSIGLSLQAVKKNGRPQRHSLCPNTEDACPPPTRPKRPWSARGACGCGRGSPPPAVGARSGCLPSEKKLKFQTQTPAFWCTFSHKINSFELCCGLYYVHRARGNTKNGTVGVPVMITTGRGTEKPENRTSRKNGTGGNPGA